MIGRLRWIALADARAAAAMGVVARERFLDGPPRGLAAEAVERGRIFLASQGIEPRFPNPAQDLRAGRGLLSRRDVRRVIHGAIREAGQ